MSSQPTLYRIAVLPGDGIGVEVMQEGIQILRAVERLLQGIRFETEELPAGAGEYRRSGEALPDQTLQACRRADAILLGAMGLPDVRGPEGVELAPQLDLREQVDLYCGLRPVRLFHPLHTPLRDRRRGKSTFSSCGKTPRGCFPLARICFPRVPIK